MNNLYKYFLGLITKIIYSRKNITFGKNLKVDSVPKIIVKNGEIIFGDNVYIKSSVEIRSIRNGQLQISNNCIIDNGVRIIAANTLTKLNNNVKIGFYSVINGGGGVEIGENTSLYGFVYIQSSKHIDKGSGLINNSNEKFSHSKISIGNNVLIGAHSSILPGAYISDNSTIDFNSVVQNGG